MKKKNLILPLIETFLFGNTYNQGNGNLKPMRVIQFIILVVALGWCCLQTGCVVENDLDSDDIDVPYNVFWPDSANVEKKFFKVASKIDDKPISLQVYSRAGVLIFSIEAQTCVWDGYTLSGQPMPAGVYFYTAELLDTSPKVSKDGFVYLFR